jgi:hypothetical protein
LGLKVKVSRQSALGLRNQRVTQLAEVTYTPKAAAPIAVPECPPLNCNVKSAAKARIVVRTSSVFSWREAPLGTESLEGMLVSLQQEQNLEKSRPIQTAEGGNGDQALMGLHPLSRRVSSLLSLENAGKSHAA